MSSELPPVGGLSGEQPEEDLDANEAGPMDEEQLNQLREAMRVQVGMGMGQPQGWRPGCVLCLNGHKLAIIELSRKLQGQGLVPGTQEFSQTMQAAAQAGAMFAQNPMAPGFNGDKPDMIPPVRQADVIVNGTSCCVICFMPQKATSIIPAGSGGGNLWRPGS